MSSPEQEEGQTISPERLMLATETRAFLLAAEQKLRFAQHVNALLAGQKHDIRIVRQDSSKTGGVNCDRLRFTPSHVDLTMKAIIEHTDYHRVKQFIIEIPQAYRGEIPALVFTTMEIEKEGAIRHLVSEGFVTEISTDTNHFELLLDLDAEQDEATSEEDIIKKLETVTLLNSLLSTYQMANQSRADGTAE